MSTLYTRLLAAIGQCVALHKSSRNQQQRYDYVSAEDVIEESRRVLLEAGLIPFRTHATFELVESPRVLADGSQTAGLYRLLCTYVLIEAETGERLEMEAFEWPFRPHTGMPEDKACAAALTESMAYALRDMLMLRRDGPDVAGRDDSAYSPAEREARDSRPPVADKPADKPRQKAASKREAREQKQIVLAFNIVGRVLRGATSEDIRVLTGLPEALCSLLCEYIRTPDPERRHQIGERMKPLPTSEARNIVGHVVEVCKQRADDTVTPF